MEKQFPYVYKKTQYEKKQIKGFMWTQSLAKFLVHNSTIIKD